MSRSFGCDIYQTELRKLGFGVPLYDPKPPGAYPVNIGDIGYLRNGQFHTLFNAFANSAETVSINEVYGVPNTFQPIQPRFTGIYTGTSDIPGAVFMLEDVRSVEGNANLDLWATAPVAPGVEISLSRTKERAAVLSIRDSATHKCAINELGIMHYILNNYHTWLSFIRDEQGRNVELHDIMFVTEVRLTADWATCVWARNASSGTSQFNMGDVFGALSARAGFSSSRTMNISIPPRYGPDPDRILASLRSGDQAPAGQNNAIKDQCIFLKCFWVKERFKRSPKIEMKGAAAPRDLDMDRDNDDTPMVLSTDQGFESNEDEYQPKQEEEPHKFALDAILEYSDADLAIVHESDVLALAEALNFQFSMPLHLSKLRYKGGIIEIITELDSGTKKLVGFLKHEEVDITSSLKNDMVYADCVDQSQQPEDLEEAITLHRKALALQPAGHPDRSISLNNLGNAVKARFDLSRRPEDLEDAISLYREALELVPAGHPDRSMSLHNLVYAIRTRFFQNRTPEDLEDAISLYREALELLPTGHPDCSISLNNLGNAVKARFDLSQRPEDLEDAITLHREALELRPTGHPDRSISVYNLANAVMARFDQSRRPEDLEDAITLHREALELRPTGHPDRLMSLNYLAYAVMTRFDQNRRPKDLEDAITLYREALELRPIGHPDRSLSLNNLAYAVQTHFNQSHRPEDLEDATSLYREALALQPTGHPDRSISLNNLGIAVKTRFDITRRPEVLEDAITLHREALALQPAGHPDRLMSLNYLANAVMARFDQSRRPEDLKDAIALRRGALELLPTGHPDRSSSLNNLASAVQTRFDQSRRPKDLEDVTTLRREALELLPTGLPDRSTLLRTKYTRAVEEARFDQSKKI